MQAMNDRPDLAFHLGDRLRKARENAGYDAKSFAMKVGITRDTLRKYESGKIRPRRYVLVAWAEASGYTLNELLGGDDGGGAAVDITSGLGDSQSRRKGNRTQPTLGLPLRSATPRAA